MPRVGHGGILKSEGLLGISILKRRVRVCKEPESLLRVTYILLLADSQAFSESLFDNESDYEDGETCAATAKKSTGTVYGVCVIATTTAAMPENTPTVRMTISALAFTLDMS